MDNEHTSGMSRRTAIKSVAAGTALVWVAPAVTTLGASAFASHNPVCEGVDFQCDVVQECGASGPLGLCVCDTSVGGTPFCWENFFCDTSRNCDTDADCSGGELCVTTCCDIVHGFAKQCAPACDTNHVSTADSGPSAAGR